MGKSEPNESTLTEKENTRKNKENTEKRKAPKDYATFYAILLIPLRRFWPFPFCLTQKGGKGREEAAANKAKKK